MLYFIIIVGFIFLIIVRTVIEKHIKIKWSTFFQKGFKAKRGNFGLYTYTGNQGKGKTLSLTEYIYDNKCNCIFFLNIKNIKCLNLISLDEYLKKDCDSRSLSFVQSTDEKNEKRFDVDSNKIYDYESTVMDSSQVNFTNQGKTLARRNLASNLEDETTLNLSESSRQLASDTDNATALKSRTTGTASSVGIGPSWFANFTNKGVGISHKNKNNNNKNETNIIDLNDIFIDKFYDSNKGLGINFNGFSGLISCKRALDSGLFDDLIKDKQIVFVFDELFTELTRQTTLSTEVQDFLCQLRKRKIIFLTTAQVWSELPLYLRRLCRYQINCNIVNLPTYSILVKEFRDAENMKWDGDLQEHVAPILETSITKCRLSVANQYDTMERITNEQVKKNEKKETLL